MQMETGFARDVERGIGALGDTEREFAERWTEAVRSTTDPKSRDLVEGLVQSQTELMRAALGWMGPGSGSGAVTGNWLTLPGAFVGAQFELQRKVMDAYASRPELRPDSIIRRWSEPLVEVTRAYQEAATRMVSLGRALMPESTGQRQSSRGRGGTQTLSGRGRGGSRARQRRSAGNGRRSAAAQRTH